MKLKSTPGPWIITEYCNVKNQKFALISTDKYTANGGIADVHIKYSDEDPRANARLIAAAPEMLEYLIEQAREMWTQDHLDTIGADEMREWMPIPIIERATGMSIDEVLKGE